MHEGRGRPNAVTWRGLVDVVRGRRERKLAIATETGGATWPISIYLIAGALITFIAAMAAPETTGKALG
jgi:hypothetical protein